VASGEWRAASGDGGGGETAGAIVGRALRRDGLAGNPIDTLRARHVVSAWKHKDSVAPPGRE
jgi:hypothetical protein